MAESEDLVSLYTKPRKDDGKLPGLSVSQIEPTTNNAVPQRDSIHQTSTTNKMNEKPCPPTKTSNNTLGNIKSWSKEIGALLLSLIALVVLILVLKMQDGKPSGYISTLVTINTIVTAISTIARAGFMLPVASVTAQCAWSWFSPSNAAPSRLEDLKTFDSASRGAIGSLKLIYRVKWRHGLATFAALITVVALAFDTLVQQLIAYDSIQTIVKNGTEGHVLGFVPRTSEYLDFSYVDGYLYPLSDMRASIYSGLMSTEVPSITTTCSTGNCTWPTIPTLAVCGSCTTLNYTSVNCTGTVHNSCTYTSNSDPAVSLTPNGDGVVFDIAAQDLVNSNKTFIYDGMNSTVTPFIAIFNMLSSPNYVPPTTAAQCGLWFCLQSYEVSSENGGYQENLLRNWSTVDYFESDGGDNGMNITFSNIPTDMNTSPNDTYYLSLGGIDGMRQAMADTIPGSIDVHVGVQTYPSNNYIQVMYESIQDSADTWISTFASHLTYTLRSSSNSTLNATNEESYIGTLEDETLIVRIVWLWLIAPFMITGMTAILLVAAMFYKPDESVGLWKGGQLAMLFVKPEAWAKDVAAGHMWSEDTITDTVGDYRAKLQKDEDGGITFSLHEARK